MEGRGRGGRGGKEQHLLSLLPLRDVASNFLLLLLFLLPESKALMSASHFSTPSLILTLAPSVVACLTQGPERDKDGQEDGGEKIEEGRLDAGRD